MITIKKTIQHSISFAYISLLGDATTLFTNPALISIAEIDPDFNLVIHDIKTCISSLDTLIGGDEETRRNWATTLQGNHKLLEKKFKLINAYSRELNHISTLLESKFHLKTTNLKDIEGIDYHQFVHEGLDFIAKSETEQEKNYKIKEILRALPMRMTKNSFTDYVADALLKIAPNPLDSENKLFLSIFKQMFDGRAAEDYGSSFADIAVAIEELRDEAEADLEGEYIEGVFDDIYLLKDTIEELYAIVTTLHNMTSYLATLLILDSLNFDLLSDEHVSFKDLFYTTRSLLTGETHGEDYTIMVETLPDRIDDVFVEIKENRSQAMKEFYDKMEKGSFPQTEETLKLTKVFSLIQFYLTLSVEDAFSFNESTDPSAQLPASVVTAATDFLSQALNTLKPTERKLRMQYLMSMLPFTMDTQAFAVYFDGAIEGTSNEVQKAYVLAKISNFMESLGYFESLEAKPDAHEDHDHDHHHHEGCNHH